MDLTNLNEWVQLHQTLFGLIMIAVICSFYWFAIKFIRSGKTRDYKVLPGNEFVMVMMLWVLFFGYFTFAYYMIRIVQTIIQKLWKIIIASADVQSAPDSPSDKIDQPSKDLTYSSSFCPVFVD